MSACALWPGRGPFPLRYLADDFSVLLGRQFPRLYWIGDRAVVLH